MTTLARLLRGARPELGATMVEYALLVAFIALVALVGVTILGSNLSSFFASISNNF